MLFLNSSSFGLIDQAGVISRLQAVVGFDWRNATDDLRVSPDGKDVTMKALSGQTLAFSISQRLVRVDPTADKRMKAPVVDRPKPAVLSWRDSLHPTVGGKPLGLEKYEKSRSLAIIPGSDHFILGASYFVRRFNGEGDELWRLSSPDEAWGVNVPADGRLVIVAVGDGTIRWLRLSDGKELLALFIHPDGKRWVAWTPQGYYDASSGADDFIGWQVNRGYDDAPDFFPVSQFREQYYRPDVVARVLDTLDPEVALREANEAAGRKTGKTVAVANLLTPIVQIKDPADGGTADRAELALTYSARLPTKDPFLRVEALVDGTKVQSADKELLTQGDTRVGKLELKLPPRDAKISVIAYNANGASEPVSIRLTWRGPGTEIKPTLYVLAIGIAKYKNGDKEKDLNLRYAAKDADDFVAALRRQEKGLYAGIVPRVLRDEKATRDAILDGLDWIKHEVTSSDVAMVFVSGHGIKTPDQRYRLLPYDYDPNRIERTTINDAELQQYLTNIGGKTLFFFDTCFSAGVLAKAPIFHPDVDKFANELRAAENGVVVFASSTGNQLSHEDDVAKNSAFTEALVEGFTGRAARPQMHAISISDLEGYLGRRVKEITKGNQTPMTAKPKTVEDFWIAAVPQ